MIQCDFLFKFDNELGDVMTFSQLKEKSKFSYKKVKVIDVKTKKVFCMNYIDVIKKFM